MNALLDRLRENGQPDRAVLTALIANADEALIEAAGRRARALTESRFGRGVYLRGLIEISNYCKNDCYYCGIRHSNRIPRYRLSAEQVLAAAQRGYARGFRSFVLQGGEDAFFTDEVLCGLIESIKAACPGSAVTLSLGERSTASYRALFAAGADRYLLRHETADADHYAVLHPPEQRLASRMGCLTALKDIGYQVGCGMMVGAPGQTPAHLAGDLCFIARFRPHMVGIGPFLPASGTSFSGRSAGSLQTTLLLLSLTRILLPDVLLPATTALATLTEDGRLKGLLAGANVVMPNLSPVETRGQYALYDGKRAAGAESVEGLMALERELTGIGYHIAWGRGDFIIKD